MKRLLPRLIFGILCTFWMLGHVVQSWHIPLVALFDHYFYDVRVRAFMPDTRDERIVIVDIDEKSLGELGRWPWKRSVLSELVRRLADDYAASVIGFDIVFAESDDSSGLPVLDAMANGPLRDNLAYQRVLAGQRAELDYDRRFAESLRGRPVVLGFYFSNQAGASPGSRLPPPLLIEGQPAPGQFPVWPGFGGNLAAFQEAAASGGHFNPLMDSDGITRRVPLLGAYAGSYQPTLALAMSLMLVEAEKVRLFAPEAGAPVEWVDILGKQQVLRIPVDADGAALVPYRGQEGSFPYVSAADVIAGRADPGLLFGKIILVGTTAPGLKDLRATPVGGSYPGVEIHANLLAGVLDGAIKERPAYTRVAEALLLIVVGGGLAVLLPFLTPLRGSLLTLGVLGALLAGNLALWQNGVVMPFASVALVILFTYGFNAAWGYFWESRTKRQLTERFGQYVPPELVVEMARNPEGYSMAGRNAEMTVLFSDVRNFTNISEGLDPKELAALMNEYLGAMTEVIRRHRGTLDKYIGDAIMAFWGAPLADPQHARHAVLVALEMQQAVKALAGPFQARGWPVLKIGIGINSGTMTVGDMGSPVRQSYTVMGDAVNLGARLEGITKEYGVGIAVGERTRAMCPEIVFRELDKVRVKGKATAVSIYEPLCQTSELDDARRAELAAWQAALEAYRLQQWQEAERILQGLLRQKPDEPLYCLYRERIAHLMQGPPLDGEWDGVTNFKTK